MSKKDKNWYMRSVRFRLDQKIKIQRRANEMGISENEYIKLRVDQDKK